MACKRAMTRKPSAMTRKPSAVNASAAAVRPAPMLRTRWSRNHREHQRNGKQLPHTRMDAASQQKFRNFLRSLTRSTEASTVAPPSDVEKPSKSAQSDVN